MSEGEDTFGSEAQAQPPSAVLELAGALRAAAGLEDLRRVAAERTAQTAYLERCSISLRPHGTLIPAAAALVSAVEAPDAEGRG